MSQRLGMADGRCFSINSSSQLVNNYWRIFDTCASVSMRFFALALLRF